MRSIGQLIAIAAALVGSSVLAGSAASQETIRIETRPYYGAVVTIESGVRVFRPLPRTSKVIINPHGQANVAVNVNDSRGSGSSNRNVNINRNTNRYRSYYSPRTIGFGFSGSRIGFGFNGR